MDDFDKKNNDINDDSDNYEFVTETIKRRPINARKIAKRVFGTVFLAVLFGLVSTVTLVIVYPRLYERLYPEDTTKQVSLPVTQEEVADETVEEFIPPTSDSEEEDGSNAENNIIEEELTATDGNTGTDDLTLSEAEKSEGDSSEEPDDVEDKNVVINQVVETIEKNLEIDDYRMLLRKISSISTTTQKSLVTVSGRKSNTDWFNNSYEDNSSSIGIILADNGKELLIISPTDILHSASYVDVTFVDGVTCSAFRRTADVNTGLCIVAVALNNIPEDTLDKIEMAEFGTVAASASGTPVVAVGAPFGVAGSMAMGQITSNSVVIDKCDTNVGIISTDIYGSTNATGVLVNYNGRIIGIICHDEAITDMPNLVRAYSAEMIMGTIEKMSNGSKLSCFGIKGTDVTKEANESLGVPMGAYVKEVVVDSPAMNIGIRNGDVITKIGTKEITSFKDYKEVLLDSNPGDNLVVTLERPSGSSYADITYEVTTEELR